MKFSEDNLLQFFEKLNKTTAETAKSMANTNKTAEKLLKVETASAKFDNKNRQKEQRHKKRMRQLLARREKHMKGPLQEAIASLKMDKGDLNGWLIAAMGLGGLLAGGAWLMSDDPNAKAIREAIGQKAKELAEWIKTEVQKAIDEGIADIVAKLNQLRDSATRGTGAGGRSSPGAGEAEVEDAPGTIEEKIATLKDQLNNLNFFEQLSGVGDEIKKRIYRLETGESMQYGPGFYEGGAVTGDGPRQIVSGDIRDVKEYNTSLENSDREQLDELDKLVRDRKRIRDKIARDGSNKDLDEMKKKTEGRIAQILAENKRLHEILKAQRDARIERVDNPIAKQTGGMIQVRGTGEGDSVPMMLPPDSFVLNRTASREADKRGLLKRQTGGFVEAVNHIKKDEALSSLTAGVNDYIKPGGNSYKTGTPWSSIGPNTPIHAYGDKYGIPTIGWGNTYYDDISSGRDKVKMGDTITKSKADKIMLDNVKRLAQRYNKMIPNWKKMSNKQRAGLLSMGYNAPNFYGAFPKITNALDRGDMAAVRKNLRWGGPSESRILESQAMMTQGPQNLNAIVGPKKVGQKIVGTGNPLVDKFREVTGQSPAVGTVIKKQKGGFIPVPGSGEGDSVPMMLPAGSFVLNRKASRALDKKQLGGVTGSHGEHDRFMMTNDMVDFATPEPPVVIVKRRPQAPSIPAPSGGSSMPSFGSGLNIVEVSDYLHRIQAGAKA